MQTRPIALPAAPAALRYARRLRLTLAVPLLLALARADADAQVFTWIRQFGTEANDQAHAVAVHDGGIYVTGRTAGALPGQTHAGNYNIYVRRYDVHGNEVWTRQFGTLNAGIGLGIAANASGVYVVGQTWGSLPGQISSGDFDAFVRKYSLDGDEEWTDQFGSAAQDLIEEVAVDESGVYVVGFTLGALPGHVTASPGLRDGFVRKYGLDGIERWTHQFGSAADDGLSGIALDNSGVYVAGFTRGALPGHTSASPGLADAFVRKYDGDGQELWTRQFGTAALDTARSVSVDASGVYVAGTTGGTLGPSSQGGTDVYVRKYDAEGQELWTRQFGTPSDDLTLDFDVDPSGIYVSGQTPGTFPGQTNGGVEGTLDAFVSRQRLDGEPAWIRQFGTPALEQATGVAVDASGIYVVGWTEGGTLPGQTALGANDAFAARLVNMTPAEAVDQLVADVVALNLKAGIFNSLDAKLEAALRVMDDINADNASAAANALDAFIHEVNAQRGNYVDDAEADALIASARTIVVMLGE